MIDEIVLLQQRNCNDSCAFNNRKITIYKEYLDKERNHSACSKIVVLRIYNKEYKVLVFNNEPPRRIVNMDSREDGTSDHKI